MNYLNLIIRNDEENWMMKQISLLQSPVIPSWGYQACSASHLWDAGRSLAGNHGQNGGHVATVAQLPWWQQMVEAAREGCLKGRRIFQGDQRSPSHVVGMPFLTNGCLGSFPGSPLQFEPYCLYIFSTWVERIRSNVQWRRLVGWFCSLASPFRNSSHGK